MQEFFALAKLSPDYVPFDTLRAVPLEPAHTASFEYAKNITTSSTFVHSIRCYYIALAMLHNGFPSATPGVPQITALAHPANAMTFELHGGIMAYEHLSTEAPALDVQQVGDIVQSMMLHTLQWPCGKSSATACLISFAGIFDLAGYFAMGPGFFDALRNRKTLEEIEAEYPSENLAPQILEGLTREFAEKPNCLLSHVPGGLDALIKINRLA